jgi:hypothetical protein
VLTAAAKMAYRAYGESLSRASLKEATTHTQLISAVKYFISVLTTSAKSFVVNGTFTNAGEGPWKDSPSESRMVLSRKLDTLHAATLKKRGASLYSLIFP